ncbi:MAG: ATP-binding cassette domain-containing protein [Actinomycetota bacterium]|nr:ATP-binding cassette domain-containing protein [Actinomycetota bacterium]
MADPFLRAEHVTVRFGGLVAVNDVSIEAGVGEIVGLIGPNGAGKTTCFGALVGMVPVDRGRVTIDGHDATGWGPARRARAGIGRTFQRLEVFGSMSVRENLAFAAEANALAGRPWRLWTTRRFRDDGWADEVLDLLGLGAVADVTAGALPLGTGRLVELGRALCLRPQLLLLDEPSSGLDPGETHAMAEVIEGAVRALGVGALVIEHDMSMVTRLCERLYVLEFGQCIEAGPTADVLASGAVQEAYLGTGGTP